MRVPDVKEARWLISRLGTRSGVIDISQSHSSRGMAKLTMRKACGFRTFHVIEVALYHALGPPPQSQPPSANSTDEPQEDAISGGGRDQADFQVVGDIDA